MISRLRSSLHSALLWSGAGGSREERTSSNNSAALSITTFEVLNFMIYIPESLVEGHPVLGLCCMDKCIDR